MNLDGPCSICTRAQASSANIPLLPEPDEHVYVIFCRKYLARQIAHQSRSLEAQQERFHNRLHQREEDGDSNFSRSSTFSEALEKLLILYTD